MEQLLPKFAEFLPAGEILPAGWLKNQLDIQANGLSGHLEEFWPDVKDSAWIGGTSEGWERGPYWLDGIVPLAYLLENDDLKGRAEHWISYIIDHQHADGWLGPISDEKYGYRYDPWPVFVFLKALTQYADITGDGRAEGVMTRFFAKLDRILDESPLRSWGQFRWGDLVLSIFWLYEKTGQISLLDLAGKVHRQRFDWVRHYDEFPYTDKMIYTPDSGAGRSELSLSSHVVNNAMAVKYPALWARLSGGKSLADASSRMIETLDRFHGQATGMFTGDEHLAGKSPSQGSELCAVAEYMYSLEWLLALTGKAAYADRLESLAFNALPATFTPDMWGHQYDQQCNQAICTHSEERIYTNNGPDSNLYGLDPNFGCCTANMHQAWPKFAASLWMKHSDGLAAFSYAPCNIRTSFRGTGVSVSVETGYPFTTSARIHIKSDWETRMKICLRQPRWLRSLPISCEDSSYHREREGHSYVVSADWHKGIDLNIDLSSKPYWESRYNGSVTLKRDPLVYALAIEERWQESRPERPIHQAPHGEWEVHPESEWAYAVNRDTADGIEFEQGTIGDRPFSPKGAPLSAKTSARLVPGWTLDRNAAAPPPVSPISASDLERTVTEVKLIPYGCTNLRITELPWYGGDVAE